LSCGADHPSSFGSVDELIAGMIRLRNAGNLTVGKRERRRSGLEPGGANLFVGTMRGNWDLVQQP
jgi:hypothetical protein